MATDESANGKPSKPAASGDGDANRAGSSAGGQASESDERPAGLEKQAEKKEARPLSIAVLITQVEQGRKQLEHQQQVYSQQRQEQRFNDITYSRIIEARQLQRRHLIAS